MKSLIILLLLFAVCGCTKSKPSKVYRIGIGYPLASLDPRRNELTVAQMINIQLFYPLLSSKPDSSLESNFLDIKNTVATDSLFNSFKICVKDNLNFSDGSKITPDDLISSLKKSHETSPDLGHIQSISRLNNNCALIKLEKPDLYYFERLMTYRTTIIKKGTEDYKVPIGLGSFKIDKFNSEFISLIRIGEKSPSGIENVEFHVIKSQEEGIAKKIDDWNMIISIQVPEYITKSYIKDEVRLLKTYVILIDYESGLREEIFNCLAAKDISKYMAVKVVPVPPSSPFGDDNYHYAHNARINPCKSNKLKAQQIQILCNPGKLCDSWKNLINSENFGDLKFKLNEAPLDNVIQRVSAKEDLITIIGLSPGDDRLESFRYFEGLVNLLNTKSKQLKDSLDRLSKPEDFASRRSIQMAAHKALGNDHQILPIGQAVQLQYFPKWILNLNSVDRSIGIYRLDQLEVLQ